MESEHKVLAIIVCAVMAMIVGGAWASAYEGTHKPIPCKCAQ